MGRKKLALTKKAEDPSENIYEVDRICGMKVEKS
jgi:hypothetical protein